MYLQWINCEKKDDKTLYNIKYQLIELPNFI